jgi:hypothetical protein
MNDDLIEKVSRAMCIEQKGDPDSGPLIEWRTNQDGVVYAYMPIKPRPLWKYYESFAKTAVRVVLEEVVAEVLDAAEDRPDASDILAKIMALGEK